MAQQIKGLSVVLTYGHVSSVPFNKIIN